MQGVYKDGSPPPAPPNPASTGLHTERTTEGPASSRMLREQRPEPIFWSPEGNWALLCNLWGSLDDAGGVQREVVT